MKQQSRIAVLGPIAALLMTVTALGQNIAPQTGSTSTATEDAEREKTALYRRFLENYKNDPPLAYTTARDYLQRFAADESGQTRYVKTFVRRFERGVQLLHLTRLLNEKGYDEKNYVDAFSFAGEMLKANPSDFIILYTMVQAGAIAFAHGNKSFRDEAAKYAQRALYIIDNETGLVDKETNLALLYVSLGVFYFTSNEDASRHYFTKFSELKSAKDDPRVYAQIADAIIRAEFEPLHTEFRLRFRTPQQLMSTEAEAIRLRLFSIAEFIVHALARAIALAGSDRRYAHLTPIWRDMLGRSYKYRNSGYSTGLSKLVQGILLKPFPPPPQHYF